MTAREQVVREVTEVEETEVVQEAMEQVKYREAVQETTEVEEPEAVQEVTEQDIFPEEEARITGISLMHGSCLAKNTVKR